MKYQMAKTKLIELKIRAAASYPFYGPNAKFQDDEFFKWITGKRIEGIETYDSGYFPLAPSTNPLPTPAILAISYLQLYINDPNNLNNLGYYVKDVPMQDLVMCMAGTGNATGNVWDLYGLRDSNINWSKSGLFFSAVPNIVVNTSFVFNFYYR